MSDSTPPPAPRREPAPLPEVTFHAPSASTPSASTTMATGGSGLSRSVIPGTAPAVDAVVHRAVGALVAGAIASGLIWVGAGRDGRLDDPERWTAYVGAAFGVISVLFLVSMLVAVFRTVVQVRRNRGHRYGITRVAIVGIVTTVAVAGGGVVLAGHLTDARDEVTSTVLHARSGGGGTIPPDTVVPGMSTAGVARLKVGTCLAWPLGPTAGDRLGDRPEPSSIRTVPCTKAHAYEVIATVPFPTGEAPYPSISDRRFVLRPICKVDLLAYLTAEGAPPVGSSQFDTMGFAPSASDWAAGYRTGVCIAIPPDRETELTASLRGAG